MDEVLCLEMTGIDKSYPGVHALKSVDFSLRKGEVHGLLGENGAGKSTLMKMLGGVDHMDSGTIKIYGKEVNINTPSDAQEQGISFIHQELSLFLDLDIATNIWIQDIPRNGAFIKSKEMSDKTKQLLKEVGLSQYSPSTKVKTLQMGERQLVEIARCLTIDTKILVLDEPTSSLTKKEVEILFSLVNRLRDKGISVIFISHRLDEVFEICDRITVMRDGTYIATVNAEDTNTSKLVSLMIGRTLDDMFKRRRFPVGKELLRIEDFCRGERFQNINFSVHEGEIVGLYRSMFYGHQVHSN